MRSLFLRIFLVVWAATVVVAAIVVASSPFFTRARPGVERWERGAEVFLGERVEWAARRIERGDRLPGPDEERRRDLDEEHRGRGPGERPGLRALAPLFVLGPAGEPRAGPPPDPEVLRFARRVAEAGTPLSERAGLVHLVGRPAMTPGGEVLVVVSAARRPPRLLDLLEPGALAWRLALLTLVVALPCLWLARQLSTPVTALRGATARLAEGDLAARVEQRFAERGDEIGALARDFNGMAARLDALVGSQRRMVRDVSHELRSPLARLRVALELARQRAGASPDAALDRIEREAERLDAMVGQILTLSRLDAASAPARREPVDLAELAAEVAADAGFEAVARRVTVAVEAPAPVIVAVDADALRSALENVVRNAVAHTREGTAVRIAVARTGAGAEIAVADRGPGVPEAALGSLFEPFFRVEEARERARGGAGLGLAIAARAVRLHGGEIAARNLPEGGLEILLRLPV